MTPFERINKNHRLGFIGLGHLGLPMARRLLTAGFPMLVYNRDINKTQALSSLGADVARDPAELAREVDVVLSCLADGAAVEAVYLGESGVLRNAKPATRIIELSTVAPQTSRKLYQAAREFGISVLDVAVSGSTPVAEAGTLTLLGGGDRQDFDTTEEIFAGIAKQWFYMGPSGSGVATKLVVNTLLGIEMQALAEAVTLGAALGLPRDLLFDTLAKTAVVSPVQAAKLASAKRYDYTPQFPTRLMHKDFGLALRAAARATSPSLPQKRRQRSMLRRPRTAAKRISRLWSAGWRNRLRRRAFCRRRHKSESMLENVSSTYSDWALTAIRAALGVVFFAHSAQKTPAWFGGARLKKDAANHAASS